MVVTESELREIWCDGKDPFLTFPPGTHFTPAAQDFIIDHNIQVLFEATPNSKSVDVPFALEGKNRTKLHSRFGTLVALIRLVAAEARKYQMPRMAMALITLAEHCREIQSACQNEYPIPTFKLNTENLSTNNVISGVDDHIILYWLNYLQAVTAEIIGLALETSPSSQKPDLVQALDQIGNAIYQLERMFKAGTIGWGIEDYE